MQRWEKHFAWKIILQDFNTKRIFAGGIKTIFVT